MTLEGLFYKAMRKEDKELHLTSALLSQQLIRKSVICEEMQADCITCFLPMFVHYIYSHYRTEEGSAWLS